jgi:CheY-like chemotaxis protein
MSKINAQTASSGEEAVIMVCKKDYDIVFMDHMMPGMDGVETTKVIRKMGGKYEKLPIIALTANAIAGAREMFLQNKFDGFISKPIDLGELNEVLKEWLPPEKIEQKTAPETEKEIEAAGPAEKENFLTALARIEEIDIGLGMSRIGGMEDIYQITVELFYNNVMPECDTMSVLLDNGDIEAFAINVHAMKSMLSTIGAMGLSEAALALELAAKRGETEYCLTNYPVLLENLLSLHKRLATIF